jgi:hypothetical protein
MVPAVALKQTQPSSYRSFESLVPELQSRLNALHSGLDAEAREEAVAEGLAYGYEIYKSSLLRGLAHKITTCSLAVFCAGLWRTGRRFTGSSATDVMADRTRVLNRVRLQPLDVHVIDQESGDESDLPYSDALIDSKSPDPYEAARANIDYASMLNDEKVSAKARRVFQMTLEDQSEGANLRIADRLGVSPARSSQIKRELAEVFAEYGYSV